jgi:hypothetical protein
MNCVFPVRSVPLKSLKKTSLDFMSDFLCCMVSSLFRIEIIQSMNGYFCKTWNFVSNLMSCCLTEVNRLAEISIVVSIIRFAANLKLLEIMSGWGAGYFLQFMQISLQLNVFFKIDPAHNRIDQRSTLHLIHQSRPKAKVKVNFYPVVPDIIFCMFLNYMDR